MEKILGIDTGTNSLGWAIVEKSEKGKKLLDKGVHIFQEGVKIEKGIESSRAAERTKHRSIRVRYYRIRMRKIHLLKVLIANHLCPPLSDCELNTWKLKKQYPKNELFMHWQRTNDNTGKNPYSDRHKCLHDILDLDNLMDRYTLGRALYHLVQRRGFLSNRKDQEGDDSGKVKEGISALSEEMQKAGFEYLGDYFYFLYNKGEKIRCHYTSRIEHYFKEFKAICAKQELDRQLGTSVVKAMEKAIFNQRPLKSQKGQVGKCVFEKNKAKCPASHPLFEEFRMLSFLNNVKIQTPKDNELRPLNKEEREKVIPLFFRKSKGNFDFEDIAKKIAPKNMYAFYKQNPEMPYLFNYPMDTSVSGCVVTACLRDIFGDDWLSGICEVYIFGEGKSRLQILNDIWHALFFYSDKEKLAEFAKDRLQLDDEQAKKFSEISMPSEYASLSLNVICKILPYLRRGMIYSRAIFLGNLWNIMPGNEWDVAEMREAAIEKIVSEMDNYNPSIDSRTLEVCIKEFLNKEYGVDNAALKKLYHPSMMETYPRVRPNDDGLYQLGSPRISSVRNPMAMRSMFRLRKLINRLLREGKIDKDTTINIEFARELNGANKRKAIADNARDNQKQREGARKKIVELYKAKTGQAIEPTDNEILKYILWEEQDHICLYTGKQIGISDFIGANPKYDIEHTVPQSVGGDSTRMNLTLCDSKYNREIKKTKLPSELSNHDEILNHIARWKDKYEALDKQIRRKRTGGATTKGAKDKIIQERHKLQLERDYWKGKYERFTMIEVPEGFSRRQGTDISIISKYARLYLKSIFSKVYTVKGIATSDFRKIWGIQDEDESKERANYVHHCIDAIVIACIGKAEYDKLAQYYHDIENHKWYGHNKAHFEKPWPTFVEDVNNVKNEIFVSHYTSDNMAKQGRKHIILNGKKVLAKGDAARGSLHKDAYYGAIERDGSVKYVVRRELASLSEKDIKNIVDDTVRGIVETAIADKGFVAAMLGPIWMNEEKQIPIKKVRCYTKLAAPLHIRTHRDISTKEYKRVFYVDKDENYAMAMYIGCDKRGQERRDFELVNMLEAALFYKSSNDKDIVDGSMVPIKSKHGYSLAYILKKGTMVLLYENTPEEIWEGTKNELVKRLYKVYSFEKDGRVKIIHHEEASSRKEIKTDSGKFLQNEKIRPAIRLSCSNLRILVQGYDFEINELGEIKRLR